MGRYTAGGALVRIRAMSNRTEDPALHSARREAWVVFAIWLLAMTYTIGVCSQYGYGRDVSDLKFVLGFRIGFSTGSSAPGWCAAWSPCGLVRASCAMKIWERNSLSRKTNWDWGVES